MVHKPETERDAASSFDEVTTLGSWPLVPTHRTAPLAPNDEKNSSTAGTSAGFQERTGRLSHRESRGDWTFFRDGSPQPSNRSLDATILRTGDIATAGAYRYDSRYDRVASPAPIPENTVCGLRTRVFWAILGAVLVIVAIAVGVGVGVGVGTKHSDGATTSSSAASMPIDPTVTPTRTPTQTVPARTTTTSSAQSTPTVTALSDCPDGNSTLYETGGKTFLQTCGRDYSGVGEAVDLGVAQASSMEECIGWFLSPQACANASATPKEATPSQIHLYLTHLRISQLNFINRTMGSTTASARVQIFSTAPDELLDLLAARIPSTVPVLRRLQFARFKNITTPSSRVIVVSDAGLTHDANVAVAYVDLRGGPDTQMWLYSSLEDQPSYDVAVHEPILLTLVDTLVGMRKEISGPLHYDNSILLGTLHSETRKLLIKHGRVEPRPSGDYDKWLFKVADLPAASMDLPAGMHWSTATLEDCRIVASRTDIPRPPELLHKFANVVIKLDDGRPIVWAFVGSEGSLVSLHCEEDFRKRGLAKLVSIKVLRDNAGNIPGDEWSSADVAPDNVGSRAMCRSLGGKPHWSVSWVLLDLAEK